MNNADMRLAGRKAKELEHIAYETSVVGSHYLEQYEYGKGLYTFNKSECINAITEYLKLELNLDDTMTPMADEYFRDVLEYTVYFYDDAGCAIYIDGVLSASSAISYPYIHTTAVTGSKTITKPTVIIIINAGQTLTHNKLFGANTTNITRYGIYEVTGRDY